MSKEHNAWARLLRQADLTPDKAAVIDESDNVVTFRLLIDACDNAAAWLSGEGIDSDSRVALYADASLDCLIAALALIRCGAVLVPIDLRYPRLAAKAMLEAAGCTYLVTNEAIDAEQRTLRLDARGSMSDTRPPKPVPRPAEQEALVLFTSGSTGEPKGVSINSQIFLERFHGHNRDRTKRTMSLFKGSITWICVIPVVELCRGDTVLIVPTDTLLDPEMFLGRLLRYQVTELGTVPSHLRMLTSCPGLLSQLRRIYVWGEFITDDLIDTMRADYPEVELFDIYSATESLGYGAIRRLSGTDYDYASGWRADKGYGMVVLKETNEPAAVGMRGEIGFTGEAIATGYLHNPKLSASRFFDNPFGEGRLYRTGDIGTLMPDGTITLHGREDAQVQIRGVRVELMGVESTAAQFQGVIGAAAFVISDDDDTLSIGLYVTPAAVEVGELGTYLRNRLHNFAMPSYINAVDHLPRTASGKLDRSELRRGARAASAVAVTDPTEAQVVDIYSVLLGIDRVNPDDDFFDLGGHSLLLVKLIAEIDTAFAIRISPSAAAELATPRRLAAYIRGEPEAASTTPPADAQPADVPPADLPLSREAVIWYGRSVETPTDANELRRWIYGARILGGHIIYKSFTLPDSVKSQAQLEEVLSHLFRRHPILCARVPRLETPHRVDIVPFSLNDYLVNEYGDDPDSETDAAVYRELSNLYDVPLVKVHCDDSTIHFAIHHSVSDQSSLHIIKRDFHEIARTLETGEKPPEILDYGVFERYLPEKETNYTPAGLTPWRLDSDEDSVPDDRILMYRMDFPAASIGHIRPGDVPQYVIYAIISAMHDLTRQTEGDLFVVVDQRNQDNTTDNIVNHIGYLSYIRPIRITHHGNGETDPAKLLAHYRRAVLEGKNKEHGDTDIHRVIVNIVEDDEPLFSPIPDIAKLHPIRREGSCTVCDFGEAYYPLSHLWINVTHHVGENTLHLALYTSHRRYGGKRIVPFCDHLHRRLTAPPS